MSFEKSYLHVYVLMPFCVLVQGMCISMSLDETFTKRTASLTLMNCVEII